MNYLLLPGNPPAAHFYEVWCDEIMRRNPSSLAKVSRYPQVTPQGNSHKAMHEVTEAHLLNLSSFYNETGQKITVIGHSLGGYFTLNMLKHAPELIEKAILLHPFLRKPDTRGQWILKIASAIQPFKRLQDGLLRVRKVFEAGYGDLAHVTDDELRNMFQLAHHEKHVIAKDESPLSLPSHFKEKVHVLYTQKDSWCSSVVILDFEGQAHLHKRDEPHGFVTEKKHRESLFTKIIDIG